MSQITVRKLNLAGEVTWQYDGRLLKRAQHSIVLEAYFDRADMSFPGGILKKEDRFVETYYDSRWYNILEIYDRDDRRLKGWYCNISRPAVIDKASVSWVDLALDLWVWPDGSQAVLDEDEFDALELAPAEREGALAALHSLRHDFEKELPPR